MGKHLRRVTNVEIRDHYLGKKMQNELITVVAVGVENAILRDIKKSKYFSVILDCSGLHCRHKSQISSSGKYNWTGHDVLVNELEKYNWTGHDVLVNELEKYNWTGHDVLVNELEKYNWTGHDVLVNELEKLELKV
uniref:Uncharacterized protein n=1 Tax=Biomphalaria glabrata TaxID=6526 RepID=A0A2C9L7H7_BIOGL